MHIYTKEKVRDVVARAMLLDAEAGTEATIEAAAQAFGIDPETVRECVDDETVQC